MNCAFRVFLAVGALATTFAAERPDDDKSIQGTWKPVKAELAGLPMAETVLKTISLKLTGGKYEVLVGAQSDKGTYALDVTATPKGMSIVGTEGPNRGRTFPAIYELNGDTLRICYDLSGADRPKEFKTVAGTKLYLVAYNRAKE